MDIIKNNKVIVRKEDASKKVFKGVSLDSLAVGEKSMAAKMYYCLLYTSRPRVEPAPFTHDLRNSLRTLYAQ